VFVERTDGIFPECLFVVRVSGIYYKSHMRLIWQTAVAYDFGQEVLISHHAFTLLFRIAPLLHLEA